MGKKCRGIRANWTSEMMEEAIDLLKQGKSQRYVEKHCGIPRRTLRNHLKSGNTERKLGRKKLLTADQENELENRIIRLSEVGVPLTPKQLRRCVYNFTKANSIENKFNVQKEMAGKDWFQRFLKRHPALSKRKAQSMNPARAQKLNPVIVKDYFTKLGNIMDKLQVRHSPHRIYNLDEKGCRLTLHHSQLVLAQKGARRVHLVAHEHAENATIVACVNAVGHTIPPMILFKGQRLKPTFKDNLPDGAVVHMAPKGSMTSEIFVKWLEHFATYKAPGKVLLILDGASCHLDIDIVLKAEEFDITIFCLPSNITHELQPLDKSVFRSFEHNWDQELLFYWDKYPDRRMTKDRFGLVFTPTWNKCMSIDNITNGFRSTGIYPYNPNAIAETAFAPSLPTHQENPYPDAPISDISSSSDEEDNLPLMRLKLQKSMEYESGSGTVPETSEASSSFPASILPSSSSKISPACSSKENTFHSILPTPEGKLKKITSTPRRKAINHKAQTLCRDLFSDKNEENIPLSSRSSKKNVEKQPEVTESWMCSICHEDFEADMRRCTSCNLWAHEECIGYTAEDNEDFVCWDCAP